MLRGVTKESLWLYNDDDLYIAYIERNVMFLLVIHCVYVYVLFKYLIMTN